MIKLKGTLVPEEEFYCTTLRDAARLLNVIGLLARVYGRPEPVRPGVSRVPVLGLLSVQARRKRARILRGL